MQKEKKCYSEKKDILWEFNKLVKKILNYEFVINKKKIIIPSELWTCFHDYV